MTGDYQRQLRQNVENAKADGTWVPYARGGTVKPRLHPTTKDIAWAAGFLEGEGSFRPGGNKSSVRITCAQVNREPLALLSALFGGNIGKYKPNSPTASDYYAWCLNGVRAAGLMMTIYMFMSAKRKTQIQNALKSKGWFNKTVQ